MSTKLNEPPKAATAGEVAQLAGVSRSTVSRALRGDHRISEDTQAKVRDAATRLGYELKLRRQMPGTGKHRVGVVAGNLFNPFYPELVERLTERFEPEGIDVIVASAPSDAFAGHAVRMLVKAGVGAIIFTAIPIHSDLLDTCERSDVPAILINRCVPGARVLAIGCNNYIGAFSAAERLLESGHRRIAFIQGRADTSTNLDRKKGFEDALERWALKPAAILGGTEYSYEVGYRAALRLMREHNIPDAVFGANDIVVMGAMDALRTEGGLRIPEDISAIGFDDMYMARWSSYNLTTVRQPIELMVENALAGVKQGLKYRAFHPSMQLLEGELVIRGSARLSETVQGGRHEGPRTITHESDAR